MDELWKSQAIIIGTDSRLSIDDSGDDIENRQSSIENRPDYLPNPQLTPGSVVCINREALFANPGYADENRDVSRLTKHRVFRRYNIPNKQRNLYHIDHLIPLSLGGSNDIRNLWPHPHHETHGPTTKAKLEAKLRTLVKRQIITLKDAQQLLRINWVEAMEKLGVV